MTSFTGLPHSGHYKGWALVCRIGHRGERRKTAQHEARHIEFPPYKQALGCWRARYRTGVTVQECWVYRSGPLAIWAWNFPGLLTVAGEDSRRVVGPALRTLCRSLLVERQAITGFGLWIVRLRACSLPLSRLGVRKTLPPVPFLMELGASTGCG